ncbi:MAG: hypothetical protein AB7N73_14995 [Gemmatimonadales bacterium]
MVSGYREALAADSGDRLDILEGLLDNTAGPGAGPRQWTPTRTVAALLEDAATVCAQKDEHVSTEHGERDPDARAWRKLAKDLEAFARRLAK